MDPQVRLIERILALNTLQSRRILAPQKGYRNTSYPVDLTDGRTVNVILYKQEPGIAERIRHSDALSDYLATQGFATRQALTPIIKLAGQHKTAYARIYSYLPGTTIPWEAYTMKHLKALGLSLAEMHRAMSSAPAQLSSVEDESRQLLSRMQQYFADSGVQAAMQSKLRLESRSDIFRSLSYHFDTPLEAQPLHMDFVRGNILFTDIETPTISGIIDFEKASYGPTAYDIARTLAFLLVDCVHKPSHKVVKYFLKSGYCKHGQTPLSTEQLRMISNMTRFYLLHDFYKFLRHNPYEFLHQNLHFVRTRDFLIKDGIIKEISPR